MKRIDGTIGYDREYFSVTQEELDKIIVNVEEDMKSNTQYFYKNFERGHFEFLPGCTCFDGIVERPRTFEGDGISVYKYTYNSSCERVYLLENTIKGL